jgi:predicted nucleotidyltransferase
MSVAQRQRSQTTYLREYPRLLATLALIVERVRSQADAPITLLALFGSVARLTPHLQSDTDLIALFDRFEAADSLSRSTSALLRIIREAQDETADEHYRWPIMPIPGVASGDDLDPDFLEGIAEDAVLLYHREGSPVPPQLARITPYEVWLERLGALLAAHGIVLSLPKVAR